MPTNNRWCPITRPELAARNESICRQRRMGISAKYLARAWGLSPRQVRRIWAKQRGVTCPHG